MINDNNMLIEYRTYIDSLPKLSIKEFEKLLNDNSEESKNKFINGFLGHVYKYATKLYKEITNYIDVDYSLMDLIQEGNLLLIEMISRENFTSFSYFTLCFYRYFIQKCITLIIKNNLFSTAKFEVKDEEKLKSFLYRYVVYTRHKSEIILKYCACKSLDDLSIKDRYYEELSFNNIEEREMLDRVLRYLTNRQLEILKAIYHFDEDGHENTLTSVAKDYQMSKQAINQIKDRSLRKLRMYLNHKNY